ncbi:MAG: hypothetical protein ABIM44_09265 [candidate division WOR-3 bacterium]
MQVSNLRNQISKLQDQITILNNEKCVLQSRVNGLKIQVDDLRRVSVNGTFEYTYQQVLVFGPEVQTMSSNCLNITAEIWITMEEQRVTGFVVNYGVGTARNVTVIFEWYRDGGLIYTATAFLGDIQGRSFYFVDTTYGFEGRADSFTYKIKWA